MFMFDCSAFDRTCLTRFCQLLLLLLFIVGCGPSKTEEEEVADHWRNFVETVKMREEIVSEEWLIPDKLGRTRKLRMVWGASEVVRTESLTSPYVGKLKFQANISVFSNGRFLKAGTYDYELEFGFEPKRIKINRFPWAFKAGRVVATEKGVSSKKEVLQLDGVAKDLFGIFEP